MSRIFRAAVALLLSGGMPAAAQRMERGAPDVIFYNGKIITVDAQSHVSEAVAIRRDRFYAVGSNAEVRALAGADTRSIDLRGHAVIPGLMDNHNHQYHVALLQRGVDLQGVRSLAGLLDRLKRAAATAPPGATLYTTAGWDPNDFPEKRAPTVTELDVIAQDRAIVVYASRGRVHVNTMALTRSVSHATRPSLPR